jgi:hypothetical protein
MQDDPHPIDKHIGKLELLTSERGAFHKQHPDVTYEDYYETRKKLVEERVKSKRVIYLDTNAWKILSDYDRKKMSLNAAMVDFAETMSSVTVRDRCIFPLGAATLFELQSMSDPVTVSTLATLVDKFSLDVAIQPPNDSFSQELALFDRRDGREPAPEPSRFCAPFEIVGQGQVTTPAHMSEADALLFKKTALDATLALPTSTHLEMAAQDWGAKWDNRKGIDEMNAGMIAHEDEITTFPDAVLGELTSIMRQCVPDGPLVQLEGTSYAPAKAMALMAMMHWHKHPASRHLVTARVYAYVHAAIRHLENRKFHQGDIADFVTASLALPNCHALFTDRAIFHLLNEPIIRLKDFCSCEVVSGFENFAAYLKAV